MKWSKWFSILTAFIFLVLTNNASAYTSPCFQYSVAPQPMPAGSVPAIANKQTLTYTPNYPIHFIGDSRTVGLEQALQSGDYDLSNTSFTAQIGKGYSWFSQQTQLTELEPSILVFNLGVNDLGNLSRYQALLEHYATTCWSKCPIYIVSVNPCSSPCTSVTNQQIMDFNASMEAWIQDYNEKNASVSTETFPIRYIDTYHYLISEGFASSDGLHYSAATYERIYSYILEHIEEPIGDGTGIYTLSS